MASRPEPLGPASSQRTGVSPGSVCPPIHTRRRAHARTQANPPSPTGPPSRLARRSPVLYMNEPKMRAEEAAAADTRSSFSHLPFHSAELDPPTRQAPTREVRLTRHSSKDLLRGYHSYSQSRDLHALTGKKFHDPEGQHSWGDLGRATGRWSPDHLAPGPGGAVAAPGKKFASTTNLHPVEATKGGPAEREHQGGNLESVDEKGPETHRSWS